MDICKTLNHHFKEINSYKNELNKLKEKIEMASDSKEFASLKKQYADLLSLKSSQISIFLKEAKELTNFMNKMSENYQKQLKLWAEKGVLEKGQTHYLADYDGTQEEGGKGENFKDRVFEIPTLEEVFQSFNETDIQNYLDWERRALELGLVITPIALSIKTLADKIGNTNIYPIIQDHTLIYDPERLDASDPKKLITTGEKRKSECIKEHKGWIIVLTPLKTELEEIDTTGKPLPETSKTNAQKIAHWQEELQKKGLLGHNFETFLATQASAHNPLNKNLYWTTLPSVSIPYSSLVSCGYHYDSGAGLGRVNTDYPDVNARCRPAVRGKRRP